VSGFEKGMRVIIDDPRGPHHGTVEGVLRSGLISVRWDSGMFEKCQPEELQIEFTISDREEEKLAPTGHVIGATYHSRYWGGAYKVVGTVGEFGVVVECVVPGGGAHQTVGEQWSHMTALDKFDVRVG
jgi:hypothetical protein